MQAPIVKIIVRDGVIAEASFYAPTLPDGEHDLYCDPGDDRIAELEQENASLLRLVYDIRVAAGDPKGRLMQDELVRSIAEPSEQPAAETVPIAEYEQHI